MEEAEQSAWIYPRSKGHSPYLLVFKSMHLSFQTCSSHTWFPEAPGEVDFKNWNIQVLKQIEWIRPDDSDGTDPEISMKNCCLLWYLTSSTSCFPFLGKQISLFKKNEPCSYNVYPRVAWPVHSTTDPLTPLLWAEVSHMKPEFTSHHP